MNPNPFSPPREALLPPLLLYRRLCSFAAALLFSPPHRQDVIIAPPQATGRRIAHAPHSSLSKVVLKPQLQASLK
jgi:hypothetical protein